GMTFQTYFDAVEKVFQHYYGRPHWGKMHTMTAEQLENLYPHFQTFLHLRQEMDPNGIFLNPSVKHLINIPYAHLQFSFNKINSFFCLAEIAIYPNCSSRF